MGGGGGEVRRIKKDIIEVLGLYRQSGSGINESGKQRGWF